ncbi:MAG: shikimate dehydrogenase [Candidatus Bathyarchaeia archaeon]
MKISGKTKVCGIIGEPIEHTLSPTMHNAAFEKLNLDFVYVPFKVKTPMLKEAIEGIRSLGIIGLNVTMPYKCTVMKYLDEIDLTARRINAVNTILNIDERLVGYNTDGVGALNALKENGVTLKGKNLLLLGAGGAGKAIAFHTAPEVEKLVIINRTLQKAKKLTEALRKEFSNKKIIYKKLSNETVKNELKDADILINATSIGMHPNTDQSPVPSSLLKREICVMDIVYNPPETKLLRDAKATGAKVISGIEMLVYQGAASFEIWTKQPAPVEVMKQAALDKLSELGVKH